MYINIDVLSIIIKHITTFYFITQFINSGSMSQVPQNNRALLVIKSGPNLQNGKYSLLECIRMRKYDAEK